MEFKLERYGAIDGVANTETESKPIRSDVEKILLLNDNKFEAWYQKRKTSAKKLLNIYKIAGDIPNLYYTSEEQKLNFNESYTHWKSMVGYLEEALDHLEKLRKFRGKYKK